MKSIDSVIKALENGFVTQKEVMALTNLSQASVSRCLAKLSESVLVLPHSSPKQFALPFDFNNSAPFDLVEVDEHGKESYIGNVHALADGKYFVQVLPGVSNLYLGHKKDGYFEGLPFFLDDLRPQGFLGNQIVKQLADSSKQYPRTLQQWNSKHIFQYLLKYGGDLPGNLIFNESVLKGMKQVITPIDVGSYDNICRQISEGVVPKSSAGGEQQKFTTFNKELNAHVLVKYTSNQNDEVTRRWKDVLITEYHALKVLSEYKMPAAEVRLLEQDNRFYLETKRFDRMGNYGRSSMFSLHAIDLEYTGLGENWQHISHELHSMDMLNITDHFYISVLWSFSQLIGNTDTHLGNISFGVKGDTFNLLPIYDMCTMAIAPKLNGLDPIAFEIPDINILNVDSKATIKAAIKFWQRVEKDLRLSDEFHDYLKLYDPVEKLKNYL